MPIKWSFTIPNYTYYAEVKRVIDGDTLEVVIDLGFDVLREETIRLMDIDTPEIRGVDEAEKAEGRRAKALVEQLIAASGPNGNDCQVIVQTLGPRDKYGRYLAWIMLRDKNGYYTVNLVEKLREAGLDKTHPLVETTGEA